MARPKPSHLDPKIYEPNGATAQFQVSTIGTANQHIPPTSNPLVTHSSWDDNRTIHNVQSDVLEPIGSPTPNSCAQLASAPCATTIFRNPNRKLSERK
ncbi:unnamed protein product [Linum trigynum]|uniref:Uncharacterized protein n=1 Tax=Linum trigynum TaxID=586398 RepID=A0AAV2G517_9ROSI